MNNRRMCHKTAIPTKQSQGDANVKSLVSAVLAAVVACTSFAATAQSKGAQEQRILFAVNEGAAGLQDASEIFLKYEEFMGFVSKALGKKVLFHLARDFKSLDAGMKNGTYQLVMVRPANFAAQAVRNYQYNLVVATKGGIAPHFIVRKDSALASLKDLRGLKVAMPEEHAYMALIARAMLREQGIDLKRDLEPTFHRDQAVIGHAVEMGIVDVGIVASVSKVAAEWDKKGGRTALKGETRIVMPVIASPSVSTEDVMKLRAALLNLEKSDDGKRLLKTIGSPGFEERRTQELIDLLSWLGV
jgi:phosphonate transport system substrate-binding protein